MRRTSALALVPFLCLTVIGEAWGWGGTAHKFINGKAVIHLPASMAQLAGQQTFLVNHASDADNRKDTDPAEAPKHFIDLELYPGFQYFPSDLNVIIQSYGATRVNANGILPWATAITVDSLTAQFRRGDWARAYQSAADLGHYVGDGHQPLHCTANFDGPNQTSTGIHSRYETSMINSYQSQLVVTPDTVHYISDPFAYAKAYVIRNNTFADSVLNADAAAKSASGGSYNSTYYYMLWQLTGRLTNEMMQNATVTLASLWYTAWVNAGLTTTDVTAAKSASPAEFELEQNYPNPFNPMTTVSGTLPVSGRVRISVSDLLGREVAVLLDGFRPAGKYDVRFDGSRLPSGVYVCRMEAGGKALSRKMLLLK
ncbi:MAG TPA: T9SS type A sorting domain-containing protein [Bacteroidota bacterium]